MPPTLLETFRILASFNPKSYSSVSLKGAPWEDYLDWAVGEGLAPMAAYNLQYVLAGAGAPEVIRDQLLSVYQGTLNDNVMKLVNFKRAVGSLEGRRIIVIGAASFAETLYPHMAFRPVEALELFLPAQDVNGFAGFLGDSEFKVLPARAGEQGARLVLSDTRTEIFLYDQLFGTVEDRGVWERALPLKVYGPSMYRLSLEDALLAVCLEQARSGYAFPIISLVDLRELVLGAPDLGGVYSRVPDAAAITARAHSARLDRALYVSLSAVERLFPETEKAVASLKPTLRSGTRALLDRLVVEPRIRVGQRTALRGVARLRRLLTGGRAS